MPILSTQGLSKSFPGVKVLQDINFELEAGEVHALLGENGAGKSTLVKILTGVYHPDGGKIFLDGEEIRFSNINDARKKGISVIHQELNLIPELDVATNIFLGDLPTRNNGRHELSLVNRKEMYRQAEECLKVVNLDVSPRIKTKNLSVSKSQLVEIAKVVSRESRIVFMDEPTSSLTPAEQARLFEIIRDLKKRGIAIVYISHKLEEIGEICDRVSILRDGIMTRTSKVSEITIDEMVECMVGRDISNRYPKVASEQGDVMLEVRDLNETGVLKDINLTVRSGEILGLSGLVGAGRTELARAIFGADKISRGEIYIEGRRVKIRNPQDAIENGMALLTEDRKTQGLLMNMTVNDNISIASLNCRRKKKDFYAGPYIKNKAVRENTMRFVDRINIKTPSIRQMVKNLSGGNQQKVILGKWLSTDAKIFIFDEPTRGIDVGAKVEIYTLMEQLTANGAAIIMISSELPEVIAISDRILVMHEGEIVAEVDAKDATEELLVKYASMGA